MSPTKTLEAYHAARTKRAAVVSENLSRRMRRPRQEPLPLPPVPPQPYGWQILEGPDRDFIGFHADENREAALLVARHACGENARITLKKKPRNRDLTQREVSLVERLAK